MDSRTGKITALKGGKTKITALFGDGKNAAKYSFTVKVTIPKLSKSSATLLTGGTAKLKLKNTKLNVSWTSSKRDVASVSGGVVTAKNAGTTIITATAEGQNYTCEITVKQPVIKKAALTVKVGKRLR